MSKEQQQLAMMFLKWLNRTFRVKPMNEAAVRGLDVVQFGPLTLSSAVIRTMCTDQCVCDPNFDVDIVAKTLMYLISESLHD